MSGIEWTFTTSEVMIPANRATTMLQIQTPSSHHAVNLKEYTFTFDSASGALEGIYCRLLRQTTTGSMTGASPQHVIDGRRETIQSSIGVIATSGGEPTAGVAYKAWEINPQAGYEYTSPYREEVNIAGGNKCGFEFTAPNTVNVVIAIKVDE